VSYEIEFTRRAEKEILKEDRSAARGLDRYLMGHSDLPAPLPRIQLSLRSH